jgi:uncharacterized protein YggU (UPF0235/DUF167 family)
VEGAANAALLRCLADALDVARSSLRLIAGEGSRRKRVLVVGRTPEDVVHRIAKLSTSARLI